MRTYWNAAYRKKSAGTILEETDTPFTVIKNSLRYWAADTFVISVDGETYVFAELYDNFKSKGTLGYCKYNGKTFTKWKSVINEKWHLSFPNVFEYKGDIYIMPEAHQSKSLYLYKTTDFPDKWEKYKTLYEGKKLADSVILNSESGSYLFTYEVNYPEKDLLYKAEIDSDGATVFDKTPISDDVGSARPGGNFFKYKGKTIRVSQNCLESYGSGLVFSEVDTDFSNGYKEKIIKRIEKEDIKTVDDTVVYGTHTYNANDEFEVIDIKTKQPLITVLVSVPGRLIKKIKRILKKQ